MGWFSKKNEPFWEGGPTPEEYDNYITGYRLGNPVESDRPGKRYIDPNDPMFQRGLSDGMRMYQEKETFFVEHPEYAADVVEDEEEQAEEPQKRSFFGWLLG